MAKIAIFLFAAIALNVLMSSHAAKIDCYTCTNCEEYSSKNLAECTKGGCFIRGDSETKKWERGCDVDEATACKDYGKDDCSFCTETECNSGSFVTGSIAMCLGVAALFKILH